MNRISYSQYSFWANCPHAWKLKYVDNIRFEDASIHTIFGTSCHEVIQEWLTQYVYAGKDNLAKSIDLSDTLKQKFITLFQKNTTTDAKGNKVFLCDKKTLMEFYGQGCEIISYVQQHRNKLFPSKDTILVGVEYPIEAEVRPGVTFVGYVDIIIKNEKTGKITIIDLKTSRTSWTQSQKSDPIKLNQILLYKKFISEKFNTPLEMIGTEFVILKRTISENSPYPIPRVSSFEPSNGKPSVNRAWGHIEQFLNECFDGTGSYKIDTIKATPSKDSCKYCVYKDKEIYCSESFYKIKKVRTNGQTANGKLF